MKAKPRCLSNIEKYEEKSRRTKDEKVQSELTQGNIKRYTYQIEEKKNDKLFLNNLNKIKYIYYLKRIIFKIMKVLKMLFFVYLLFIQKEKNKDKNIKKLSDKLSYQRKIDSSYYNINKEKNINNNILYIYIYLYINIPI